MQRLRRRRPSGHDPSEDKATRSHSSLRRLFMVVVVLLIPRSHHDGTTVEALLPASSSTFQGGSKKTTVLSPLFVGPTTTRTNYHHHKFQQRDQRRQQQQQQQRTIKRSTFSSASTTALSMVLTTPESIIEQASTVNLLDDLIDESVRTSPRRPIMMQVCNIQTQRHSFSLKESSSRNNICSSSRKSLSNVLGAAAVDTVLHTQFVTLTHCLTVLHICLLLLLVV